MRWILPFAILLNIVIFVQCISDAITWSYMYLIDAGLCLGWFAIAVPTYTGFLRNTGSAYRWNIAYELFMLTFLTLKGLMYLLLVTDRSFGMVLLLAVFISGHIWELIWYHGRKNIFTKP